MPLPKPHRSALFSLYPLNQRAEEVVTHPSNAYLASCLDDALVLNICYGRSASGDKGTLATIGRNGDIIVEGSTIARVQCSFEIDLQTKIIMFYDRSHSQTCQVYGENATPFEHTRPSRKVVVRKNVNTIIGMGGVARNLIKFELRWHNGDPDETNDPIDAAVCEGNPRLARTMDEAEIALPSQRTRVHTRGSQQMKIRFQKTGNRIGVGQFGEVYKAVDLDAGKLVAVKILHPPPASKTVKGWTEIHQQTKREVEFLSRISCPHIIDYLGSQGWNTPNPQIFMGLKTGSLEQLVRSNSDLNPDIVFHHILQALGYLAFEGLIHRDVKPENILYVEKDNEHHFQLGDFGFSNYASMATTFAGTPKFMAPEMFREDMGLGSQTHKVDIWSLYVTMVWTLDIEGFREASGRFKSITECQNAISSIASGAQAVECIEPMARKDPEKRASAAQMLVELFGGRGLSTPRAMVPCLILGTETPKAKAPTVTSLKRTRVSSRQRDAQDSENQFHMQKARHHPVTRRGISATPVTKTRRDQGLGRRTDVISTGRPWPSCHAGTTHPEVKKAPR
ncbi:hypothetical protein VPNG_06404 [Cytospora leucostoma]|uniref:non-specific serine/threonine protein kinase n=1 Tax=Cytospora leucostoma TaxID=1230097 RepID=A0A423WZ58_9PEZI|nr:hypothetical protein VPNG_06404 [Cytospora leucostoma]